MPRGIPNKRRKPMSAEARARISDAMKAHYARERGEPIQPVVETTVVTLNDKVVSYGKFIAIKELVLGLPVEQQKQLVLALIPTFIDMPDVVLRKEQG